MLSRLKAMQLLSKCSGDEIWSIEICEQEGVPREWIEELVDTTESGFNNPTETLFVENRLTNQFHGVQDLRLAYKLGEFLGVDTSQIAFQAFSRAAQVEQIKETVEEG